MVETAKVTRLVVERDRLAGVELADGRTVPRTAMFIAPRFVPIDGLLRDLGCAVDENGGSACTTRPRPVSDVPIHQVAAAMARKTAPAIAVRPLPPKRPALSRASDQTSTW